MQAQLSDVPYLAASFKDGGPFFVSMLFVVIVSGWAAHLYRAVCERKDPPPTPEERNTYRLYFFYAVAVGAIATGVSLWWWVNHESVYTLRGSIRGLSSAESVWSDDVFFKPRFSRGGQEGRAEEFIIVKNAPFKAGEEFVISYQKTGGDIEDLNFRYSGARPDFRVSFKDGSNQLQPLAAPPQPAAKKTAGWDFSLVDSAYAGVTLRKAPVQQQIVLSGDDASILRTLQNDRVYVGTEVKLLEALRRRPLADRQRLASLEGPREPMLVTLLDLTRHEDPQVAYLANATMKGIDALGILRAKLADTKTRKSYLGYVNRIDKALAQQALSTGTTSDLRAAATTLSASRSVPRLLRATPAGDGDEFWVTGVGTSPTSAKCMTDKLAAQPDSSTPARPKLAPAGNRLTTYSYSKAWVAQAAGTIEQCGGTPLFGRALLMKAGM